MATAASQRIRKRIEEAFGWIRIVAGQDEDQIARPGPRWVGLHLRGRRLQSGAGAQALGGVEMTAPAGWQLIGRWRIIEADLWDRGYLNLGGPATIATGPDNNGEIAFGALQAGLDRSYSPSIVHFTWGGCDEMDEVTGDAG